MAGINQKVTKNAAWIIGIRSIQSILALVISFLTARYLEPSNYGLISYAASLVAFLVPIMQLGLSATLVQELIARPKEEGKVLGTSLILTLISSLACMAGAVTFAMVANAGETVTVIVCALYSLMLPAQALEMMQYWFQAKFASKYVSVTSLVAYLIVSAYKIYLLVSAKDVYWFAVSNALDYAIIGVALIVIYRKLSKSGMSFSFSLAKKLLHRSRYYILSNMMITVFTQTDRIMLKLMVDDAAVGHYAIAASCAGITSFVFGAVVDSMRPLIIENKEKDSPDYESSIISLYSLIIYAAILQSVVVTLCAPILVFLLGAEYAPAVPVLQVLVWYTTFAYYGAAKDVWILAESKQHYLAFLNLGGAIANILLNLFLIPVMGPVGAAVASLVTQVISNIVLPFFIKPLRHTTVLFLRSLNPKYLRGTLSNIKRAFLHKVK